MNLFSWVHSVVEDPQSTPEKGGITRAYGDHDFHMHIGPV